MISIQREWWDTYYPDCGALLAQHRAELDGQSHYRYEPNLGLMEATIRTGQIQVLTARLDDGKLVGYIWLMAAHPIDCTYVKDMNQGPFFVLPEYRNTSVAYRLFSEALRSMMGQGVQRFHPHHWLVGDSPKAAKLFEHFGAKRLETVYQIDLEGTRDVLLRHIRYRG